MATSSSRTAAETMRLLLVGKTGAGKSSTGNSIVGKKAFYSAPAQAAVTSKCQAEYAHVLGRRVKVVDMPGLADAALSEAEDVEKVIEEAMAAVAETPEGYDAILTVIAFGRLSREEKKTIEQLKAIFGKNYVADYGILLVTRGDQYDPEECQNQTFEEWCSSEKGILYELQEECSGRIVLFDNKSKEPAIKKDQLERLFSVVDTMRSGQRFLPACFEEAKEEREKLILEAREPVILEETQMETRLMMNDLDDIDSENPARALVRLGELRERAENLLQDVKQQDKGTGALRNAINLIESVKSAVRDKVSIAESIMEKKDLDRKLANLAAEQVEERERLRREIEEKNRNVTEMQESLDTERKELEEKYQKMVEEQEERKKKIKMVLVVTAIGIGVGAALTGGVALLMNPAVGTAIRAAAPAAGRFALQAAQAAAPVIRQAAAAAATKVGEVALKNIERKMQEL